MQYDVSFFVKRKRSQFVSILQQNDNFLFIECVGEVLVSIRRFKKQQIAGFFLDFYTEK